MKRSLFDALGSTRAGLAPDLSRVFGASDMQQPTHESSEHEADLRAACYIALALPRHEARLRALDFSWTHAAQLFEGHLVPARADRHSAGTGTGFLPVKVAVTPLS